MKIKTSDLKGAALDWAVASIEIKTLPQRYTAPLQFIQLHDEGRFNYSQLWAQGGPILDKLMDAGLQLIRTDWSEPENKCRVSLDRPSGFYYGPTVLIATMRCYVASVLGNEVDIPEELL